MNINHFQPSTPSTFRSRPQASATLTSSNPLISRYPVRIFSISRAKWKEDYASQAKALNQKSLDEHEEGFNNQIDNAIGEAEELQARTPWHREGSDRPPVKRMRSASAMTKGIYLFLSLQLPLLSPPYQYKSTHNTKTDNLNRQTPDNPLTPPQTHSPSHNNRQEHRPQIHRTSRLTRPPTTTSLLPRTLNPV